MSSRAVTDRRSVIEIDPETGNEARAEPPPAGLVQVKEPLPGVLFTLPVEDQVLFPGMALPLAVGGPRALATLEQVRGRGQHVAIVTRRPPAADAPPTPDPDPDALYPVGGLSPVVHHVDLPDGSRGVMVVGGRRLQVQRWVRTDPVLIAEVTYPDESLRDPPYVLSLVPHLRQAYQDFVKARPDLPDQLALVAGGIEDAARLTDFVAANLGLPLAERQGLLATFEVDGRVRQVIQHLDRQLDLARLGEKARHELREKIESSQREHYLREQLRTIRRELGEEQDEKSLETEAYRKRIAEARLPEVAEQRAQYELRRLSVLPQEAAEYHVIRTYLDWIVDLPWSRRSEDSTDLRRAGRILEADHHGLEEVKARILELLAVRRLRPDRGGAILCLVGPPGVGKTSLGQSVARAMGRRFHRIALGGLRDEAEIKGHRRTYVGAMPGRILQGLRRVGTRNPVLMLDEIDKLASDHRGDPASALLEVLDPAQNHAFDDHYLDLPFDLSDVMFIATANYAGQIPAPLLDRMEVIELPGYIPDEKRRIATRYQVPRQREANGLQPAQLDLPATAIDAIVRGWTREAGVRDLERRIGQICRKVAARVATGQRPGRTRTRVTAADLPEYLGPARFGRRAEARITRSGITMGLAWTPAGGDVLFIEVTAMPGRGPLKLTGHLGQVMSESAQIAYSVVRANARRYGIPGDFFTEHLLHVHVPEGAVPKDGPSAGITLATAIASVATRQGRGQRVLAHVAMTGELTLRGQVLPVGGIREKVVAAKAAGLRTLVMSEENRADVEQLPARVRRGLTFVFVETLDEVLRAAFPATWRLQPGAAASD